jgi:hypothetical protein
MTKLDPRLTVILITPDRFETIRKTVSHMRAQTIVGAIELIITCPSKTDLEPVENDLEDFHSVQIVEVGPVRSIGRCYASGVTVARAPIIACGEEHSFPAPDWAEALLERHEEDWACVGPDIQPANSLSMASWSQLFMNYGPCVGRKHGREVDFLPSHNAAYKKKILLDNYPGDELEEMLEGESVLFMDLRRRGYKLFLEPRAKILHLNISKPSSYIPESFHGGRQFGAARARTWAFPRRLLYAGASPLIPFVRVWRIVPEIWRSERRKFLLPMFPSLVLCLVMHSLGEAAGYLAGVGNSGRRKFDYEFHRYRYITARDVDDVFGTIRPGVD